MLPVGFGHDRASGEDRGKGERMASKGRELLGELYERDHLTFEELDLSAVTEDGATVPPEGLARGSSASRIATNRAATWRGTWRQPARARPYATFKPPSGRREEGILPGEPSLEKPHGWGESYCHTAVAQRTDRWESARGPVQLAW